MQHEFTDVRTPTERPRTARVRRYLMCPPTHFRVDYAINPWMDPSRPVDVDLAMRQWEGLRDVYVKLGHTVEVIAPLQDLPDMVFSANGATMIDGRVLVARFRHAERAPESRAYLDWFRARGYDHVRSARFISEGEGDFLVAGKWLLAGTGFRSDRRSHAEAQEFFGRPVVGLTLIDPRYYHLDTALAVLEELFAHRIVAGAADAEVFGLNAVSDGRRVVLPEAASDLHDELRDHGFEPIGVDVTEMLKSGGSVKCCTLELRA